MRRIAYIITGVATIAASLFPTAPVAAETPYGDILAFSIACDFVRSGADDPIVFPGQPGRSHMHDFFGNPSTDPFTTTASLLKHNSTCGERGWSDVDRSAYWVPTLMKNDQIVKLSEPVHFTAYYRRDGGTNGEKVNAIPLGLRMVGGDPKATTYEPGYHAWGCRGADGEIKTDGKNFPTCPRGTDMKVEIGFPACWNGRDLDSPDHQSHMDWPRLDGWRCAKSHPIHLPQLTIELSWPGINGDLTGYSLSSGPPGSSHGDFFNGWDPNAQQAWIDYCMRTVVGPVGCEGLYRNKISFTPTKFDLTAIANDPRQASKAPADASATDPHANHAMPVDQAAGVTASSIATPGLTHLDGTESAAIDGEPSSNGYKTLTIGALALAVLVGLGMFIKRRRQTPLS